MNNISKKFSKVISSVHFRITLIFTFVTLAILGLVGAFFVVQYSSSLLNSFNSQLSLPTPLRNELISGLQKNNTLRINRSINEALSNFGKSNRDDYVYVVDKKGVIRGTSSVALRQDVNRKMDSSSTAMKGKIFSNIKNSLSQGKNYHRTIQSKISSSHYKTLVVPLETHNGNRSSTVGSFVYSANMEGVYSTIHNVIKIFIGALLIPLIVAILIGFLMARILTNPIRILVRQTGQIEKENFLNKNSINTKSELGTLAKQINNLSDAIAYETAISNMERDRLNSILANMNDGVLSITRNGTVTLINQTALDFLNITDIKKAVGKNIYDLLNLKKRNTSLRTFFQATHGFFIKSRNSSNLILNIIVSLIRRKSGFISGAVVVLRDVTQRVEIEKEQKDFVSNVSHELRTPLTSVNAYIETLQEENISDKKVTGKFLDVAHRETQRMIRMINDLLELSRMDRGTVKMEKEPVNFIRFIEYALNRFKVIIKQGNSIHPDKKYNIIRKYDKKKSLYVDIDANRFMQVIDNLINNAINYSPEGSNIEVDIKENSKNAILSITDHGLGISKKDQNNIFRRFYRADKSRSRQQGGTGLGLAISKEVVQGLKGKIWVKSKIGKGTTFFVSIPKINVNAKDLDFE